MKYFFLIFYFYSLSCYSSNDLRHEWGSGDYFIKGLGGIVVAPVREKEESDGYFFTVVHMEILEGNIAFNITEYYNVEKIMHFKITVIGFQI